MLEPLMPIYRVFQSCSYDTAGQTFLMRCIDYATALERGKHLCGSAFQRVELTDVLLPPFITNEHHSEKTGT
jgi:hypothetical protein